MFNATNAIRLTAVITVLYGLGHTTGYPWTPGLGPTELEILEKMRTHTFDVMGSNRSYWDFYVGFGLGISILQIGMGLVLWFVGDAAKAAPKAVTRILWVYLVAFLGKGYLAWKFFFAPPLVFCAVISALLVASLALQRKKA